MLRRRIRRTRNIGEAKELLKKGFKVPFTVCTAISFLLPSSLCQAK
jgi:hypothetical protein